MENKIKILIADDEIHNRDAVSLALEPEYDVITESSIEGAWKILKNTTVDLILLDIYFPPDSEAGIKFCDKLKKDNKFNNIPIIMLSVKGASDDFFKAENAGADGYLTKPFSINELRNIIEEKLS